MSWPGLGGVQVYDASEPPQYLGILVGIEPFGYILMGEQNANTTPGSLRTIFIPDLDAMTIIHHGVPGDSNGGILRVDFFFEENGCSGKVYAVRTDIIFHLNYDAISKYYVGRGPLLPLEYGVDVKSVVRSRFPNSLPGGCSDLFGSETIGAYEAVEIPEGEIPFTLPVAFPLHYVSE
jgi:hypothetical protein